MKSMNLKIAVAGVLMAATAVTWAARPPDKGPPTGGETLTNNLSTPTIMIGKGFTGVTCDVPLMKPTGMPATGYEVEDANIIASTYITTASLPLRYEIFNTAGTSGASTMKQICSTVISEGGYELRGSQLSAGTSITSPRTFAVAGTYYPIMAIKLKSTRLDAIVIPTAVSLLGLGNGKNYQWRVINGGVTTTGGTWLTAAADPSVEYNITATSASGGRVLD